MRLATVVVEVRIVDNTVVPVTSVDEAVPEEIDFVVEATFVVTVETTLEKTVAVVVEVDICSVAELENFVVDGRYAMPRLRPTPKIMATAENASMRFEYSDKAAYSPYCIEGYYCYSLVQRHCMFYGISIQEIGL